MLRGLTLTAAQHPYLFKLPNEDAVESGELQYDARYWFQVTSVDTGDSDDSPDYYLSEENVLKRGPRPDGDDGDDSDDDNGSAPSSGGTSGNNRCPSFPRFPDQFTCSHIGALPSSTATSSTADSMSSSEPTATGDSSNNGEDGSGGDNVDSDADDSSRTGVSPTLESGETQGSEQQPAKTSGSGPASTGSTSESSNETGREDEGNSGDDGDNSSLDDKTKIIIGVSVGLGGCGLLLLGLFCFVKRRKHRQRKSAQAAGVERDTVPELDNVEAKSKQELEGGERHEKSNDHQVYEKDGGHALSELPGVPVLDGDLHTDGRYGGRSEMVG